MLNTTKDNEAIQIWDARFKMHREEIEQIHPSNVSLAERRFEAERTFLNRRRVFAVASKSDRQYLIEEQKFYILSRRHK